MIKEPFPGFDEPTSNYSKMPHTMIDSLPQIETLGEMKVILYILRHTWGFQDDQKKITLDEFESGRKLKDGTRMDGGTGLSKPTIMDGLKRAEQHGFIVVETDDSDKARVKRFYSLRMKGKDSLPQDKARGKEILPLNQDFGKESLPRSEKETTKKETFSKAKKSAVQASFPGSAPKWVGDPPPAVRIHQTYAEPKHWPKGSLYVRIHETVGDDEEKLEFWGKVVEEYIALGWYQGNVAGMLEWFERGELPHLNSGGKKKQGATVRKLPNGRTHTIIEGRL